MRFVIDNALPPKLAAILREVGHDAVHVRELRKQDASDQWILEFARVEDRIIVSADSDFAVLLALQEWPKPSFVLFREPDLVQARQYADCLLTNLAAIEGDLLSGCVVAFRRGHVRVRSLPIS